MRRVVTFLWIPIGIAALYLAWIFFSRGEEDRRLAREAAEKQAASDRKLVDAFGNGQLKIMSFYAYPGVIHPRDRTQICYGVSNAKEVVIEPHIEDTKPALSYCMTVQPAKTTTYTITAKDDKGNSATQSFDLKVVH